MENKKKAFITGITGQDGSYLADLLLSKGYEVHGLVRRASTFNRERIEHIYEDAQHTDNIILHYGDLTDSSSIARILYKVNPDEIYNLGAQSHVRISFDTPEYTTDTVALGTLRLLDAIKETGFKTKFYQASSSEMYGKVLETPQSEITQLNPRSPYAIAKVSAHFTTANYREAYGLYACSGILFNHESPRRGENFVTRKITMSFAEILAGKKDKIYLGNLDAKRDWGYAPEYVEAMWRMLQQDKPEDFVIATGETHTVREFVEETARLSGFELEWKEEGVNEKGVDKKTGKVIIEIDSRYYRPTEVDILIGDPKKAKDKLGWEPKVTFKDLVKIMLEADCEKYEIMPNI